MGWSKSPSRISITVCRMKCPILSICYGAFKVVLAESDMQIYDSQRSGSNINLFGFLGAVRLGCVEIPSGSFADGSFEGSLQLQDDGALHQGCNVVVVSPQCHGGVQDAQAKGQASLQANCER